ncbi:hypothetical protein WR25_25155 [Diploscapter pachys]|uniref:Glucosylceramidase n=1 Tax=Diploscapter pachys TaxID=2018661 RepID=A0A2A2LWF8_9BILA|nr:hypothetical protein WR25_25155 [Diploscapter pachys]
MASCDFSTHEYSYDDVANDFNLTNFNLTAEDFRYKIPYILKAKTAAGGSLRLFSTPWSPPGWMKSNGRMKGGGVMKGDMNGQYYQTWAKYFVRFFEEYHKAGIDFWGTTIQNEPTSGLDPFWKWQTMYLSAAMERDFLKGTLGPVLKSSPFAQNLSIMIVDDQRSNLPAWPDTILSDPDAAKYVSGIALHWYEDVETSPSLLTQTHQNHPDYFIFGTEACTGYLPLQGHPELGSRVKNKRFVQLSSLQDLLNWSTGWMDWNLVLDMQGGPNWVGNFVDAGIIVDSSRNIYYKNPMWHVMGHFAKFIRPGSVRISGEFQNLHDANVEGVAFKAPDGSRVAVILNKDAVSRFDSLNFTNHNQNMK